MTAIILAGGKSRRMGSHKALLRFGDKTFIEHQVAVLSKIFDEILISANERSLYKNLNLTIVPDIIPEKGPLGGITAGLIRATSSHAFVVACDMPFLNEEVILYLKGLIDTYDVVVPQTSRGLEPMHAFYSRDCIEPMQRCIQEGRLRIIDFFSEVRVRVVGAEEFAGLDTSARSLVNLNTAEEYKHYCNNKTPDGNNP